MVNALFSSKCDGTKQFKRGEGCVFGWKAISDLYKRELVRVKHNQARMVPRLREAHILRDSWTKLNVLPAKIMQVSNFYDLKTFAFKQYKHNNTTNRTVISVN